MRFLSKIFSKSSVGAVALGAMMAFGASGSMAATCDVGGCNVVGADGQTLSGGVAFSITEITNETDAADPDFGTFNFVANFLNDTTVNAVSSTTVLQFQPTNLASINNLALTIFDPAAAAQTFQITDANGAPIGASGNDVSVVFDLSAAQNQLISFEFQGEAVQGSGLNPGIQLTIAAVPLPAGGLLLLTALGGFAAVRRKHKAA